MLASHKVKEKDKEKKQLLVCSNKLQREHIKKTNSQALNEIRQIKKRLDQIELENVEKAIIFAKQKYNDNGPKLQKLLAFRLKKQNTKSRILKIKDRNKAFVVKSTEIANAFLEYHQQWYTPESQDINTGRIQKYFENIELAGVTEDQNTQLIKPITEQETIRETKNEKCPDSDGFTNESYKEFQQEIIPLLCEVGWGRWRQCVRQAVSCSDYCVCFCCS